MNTTTQIRIIRKTETDFLGQKDVDYSFTVNEEAQGQKLTRQQTELIREIRDGIFKSTKYVVTNWSLAIYKSFVSLSYQYFDKSAKNTIFCTKRKHVMIGKKGAIKFFEHSFGLGESSQMIPKYRSIVRDYAINPEDG